MTRRNFRPGMAFSPCSAPFSYGLLLILILPFVMSAPSLGNTTLELNSPDDAALFQAAAEATGDEYVKARDTLANRIGDSPEIAKLLKSKLGSNSWRERYLAEVILLEKSKPQFVEQLRLWAKSPSSYLNINAGKATAELPKNRIESSRKNGVDIGDWPLKIDQNSIPVLVDCLYEAEENSWSGEHTYQKTLQVFAHVKAAPAAQVASVLLDRFSRQYYKTTEEEVASVIAGLGKEALPVLHQTLQDSAAKISGFKRKANDAKQNLLRQQRTRMTNVAVLAMGKIGNEESARLLIEHLSNSAQPFESTASLCRAISRLAPDEGAEVVFRTLCTKFKERSFDLHQYFDVRQSFIAMGADSKSELEKQLGLGDGPTVETSASVRAIARGILFEVNHPEELRKFYRSAVRNDPYSNRASDDDEGDGSGRGFGDDDEGRPQESELELKQAYSRSNPASISQPHSALPPPIELLVELGAASEEHQYLPAIERVAKPDLIAFNWLTEFVQQAGTSRPWIRRRAIFPMVETGGTEAVEPIVKHLSECDIEAPFLYVQAAIEIGNPSAAKIFDAMLHPDFEYVIPRVFGAEKPATTKAGELKMLQQLKNIFESSTDLPKALLDYPDRRVQLAAAISLGGKQDLRSIPLLFDSITKVPRYFVDSRRKGRGAGDGTVEDIFPGDAGYLNRIAETMVSDAEDVIVAMGEKAIPVIENAAAESDSEYSKLLAMRLRLRILEPAKYRRFIKEINAPFDGWKNRGGPREDDLRQAGIRLAQAITPEYLWFLKSEIVWSRPPKVIIKWAIEILENE